MRWHPQQLPFIVGAIDLQTHKQFNCSEKLMIFNLQMIIIGCEWDRGRDRIVICLELNGKWLTQKQRASRSNCHGESTVKRLTVASIDSFTRLLEIGSNVDEIKSENFDCRWDKRNLCKSRSATNYLIWNIFGSKFPNLNFRSHNLPA